MPFSFRRDSDTRPSQKASQMAPCVFRSIRTPTLRPFSSGTNWIPGMDRLSLRRRHRRIVHVPPAKGLGFPPQATIAFPVNQWIDGSKTDHSNRDGGVNMMRDLPRYVKLIEKGLYDAKSLITSTYPLEKTMHAYHAVADRTTVTAMITFA